MYKPQKTLGIRIVVTLILFGLLAPAVFAGIPEPGVILYGQVRDDTGVLLTSGEMTLTFTPTGGGDAVTVSAELTEIEGPGGPYSYRALIPFESEVPGSPVSDNAIPLTSTPVEYERTAEVVGTGISRTDYVNISTADRGSTQLVLIGASPDDTDSDGLPDSWEQQIVDADPNDAIASIDDVLPGDDFDGDGESNLTEHSNGTDPTDAMSTNDPANAYTAFHFEIYRGALQTEGGEFTPSFWGAHLICWPRESETLVAAALTKPTAGGGDETFILAVTAQGDEAEYENEDYASIAELMADYVPGDYWVDLEVDSGDVDTHHLRFKLTVPDYTEASFPDHIAMEAPLPYATRVSPRPLLDFDSELWDYVSILRVDTEEEVYLHIHDAGDDPADKHQVPSEDSLRPITQYYVVVDTSDWGNTWLGSMTAIEIETTSVAMPWIPLLLLED